MDDDKRNPPWTLNTIGEVIESMEQLKEEGLSDETPIVWLHLENHNLEGQEIENIMILNGETRTTTFRNGGEWRRTNRGIDFENDEGRKHWVEITLQEQD